MSGRLLALSLLLAVASAAVAQGSRDQIQQRFRERYRALFELKVEGRIGETFEGYVQIVADVYGDDDVEALVTAENRDRRTYYELLAVDLKKQAPPEQRDSITARWVGRRNAKRTFQDAEPFEHLELPDGVWVQKKDLKAYEQVLKLKRQGLVGEAATGYLAVRRDDGSAAAVVKRENERRRAFYRTIARAGDDPIDEVASTFGRAHFKAARPEDWLLAATGDWIRAGSR